MFSIPGHPFGETAALALGRPNEVVREVAGRYDVGVAELSRAFDSQGGELTHLVEFRPGLHPNDAGHRVIAEAFAKTLGLE